jgi:signal peptidase II
MNKSPFRYFLLTLVLILIDQSIKMWVHFNMFLGEEIPLLGDWFKIHYVTNEGMAFGMRLEAVLRGIWCGWLAEERIRGFCGA